MSSSQHLSLLDVRATITDAYRLRHRDLHRRHVVGLAGLKWPISYLICTPDTHREVHFVNDATPAPKEAVPPSRVIVAGLSAATTAAVEAGRHVAVANSRGCPEAPATGPPVSASAKPAPVVMKTPTACGNISVATAAAVAYRSGPEILLTLELYVLSLVAIPVDTAPVPPRIVIEDGLSLDNAAAASEGSVVGLVNKIAACRSAAAAVPARASGKLVPVARNTGLPTGKVAARLAAVAYLLAPATRVTGPVV
jgi:hypothetical protein